MTWVVGIDPGLANFGYAVARVVEGKVVPVKMGVITTRKSDAKLKVLASDDNTRRGREVSARFREVLPGETPVAFCLEAQSFPRNASAAAKTAISWGIVINVAETMDVPIFQVRPQELKHKMCGIKSASKKDVQQAVDAYFEGVVPHLVEGIARSKLEHAYDALAAVVACSDSEAMRLVRRMT